LAVYSIVSGETPKHEEQAMRAAKGQKIVHVQDEIHEKLIELREKNGQTITWHVHKALSTYLNRLEARANHKQASAV
jgi:tRNA (Thr-GGU) A37 N-methylase